MQQEWRYFLLAISFFTRLPVPSYPDFQENHLNHASKYFPLVGLLVGGISAVAFSLAALIFPQDIAVALSMLTSIYMTGCFHEDGLADSVDGLGGGWTSEQKLTIMQDSRIGSYGAVALILMLLLKFLALNHIPAQLLAMILIAAHTLSRYAALLVMATQVYVRSSGKAKPMATCLTTAELWLATAFVLISLLAIPWRLLPALLLVALSWLWFSYKLKRQLGGYTGDTLGAMQQLTETAFYLGIVALST